MADRAGTGRLAAALAGPGSGSRRGLLVAALAGAVAGLGQAPFGFWPAMPLALAVLYALVARAPGARGAFGAGWAFGAGYFALTLHWIVEPFFVNPWVHGWMAPFAILAMAGGLALFWGAGAALARWLAPPLWLSFPVALTLSELARGNLLTGFPWALPAYVWTDTAALRLAPLVGPYGLTLLTLALAPAIAGAARRLPLVASVPAALALAALPVGLGLALPGAAPGGAPGPVVRVVQPNAPQHLKWTREWAPVFYERAVAATAAAPAPGMARPGLVVWPETAVPYVLDSAAPSPSPPLVRVAEAAGGAPVLVGIQRREGAAGYNSLVLLGPDGTPRARYDKHHLVPFGEYIPGVATLAELGLDGPAVRFGVGYGRGPGPGQLIDVPGLGPALPLICYEVIFPGYARASPRPRLIVQATNDAWFGTFAGPQQHLVQARFRAAEQGLPLVRAANTGISAVIGPRGRVLASLPLGETGHVDAALPAALAPTPYARTGDAPLVLALIALAAVLGARALLGRT